VRRERGARARCIDERERDALVRDLDGTDTKLGDVVGGRLDPQDELGERFGQRIRRGHEKRAHREVALLCKEVRHLLEDEREDGLRRRHSIRLQRGSELAHGSHRLTVESREMSRRRFPTPSRVSRRADSAYAGPGRDDDLVARALRCRRKGETRKMLIALREACMRDEGSAWLWTLYGAALADDARTEEATRALKHALWLRHAAKDTAREHVTKILLDRVSLRSAA
jgi:hypothetical protein